jgi:hypothetical protein
LGGRTHDARPPVPDDFAVAGLEAPIRQAHRPNANDHRRGDGHHECGPLAAVLVVNTATSAATNVVSSDSGSYAATNPPGTYRIEAMLQGFQTSNIEASSSPPCRRPGRRDPQPGARSPSRSNVVAENATIQTEDAKVATTASNRLIDEPARRRRRDAEPLRPADDGAKREAAWQSARKSGRGSFGATPRRNSCQHEPAGDPGETARSWTPCSKITEFAVETNGFS